ncbi:HB21 protein, partial [Cisticola juncidis]|nr:HB21 protein [Cisticola juncidis]
LVPLGAPLAGDTELSALFQEMMKSESHFINGTDRVRSVERNIHTQEQLLHLGSDVGLDGGGHLLWGEAAGSWNSAPEWREHRRAVVERHCWHNSELCSPVLREHRVPPSLS